MNFHHTKTKEAVTITATTAAGKPLPPSEWMAHASGAALMAVATLKTLADSNEAQMDGEGFTLGHSQLVELPEHEAKALGLPPRAPFALQVQHQGLPSEPHFSLQWQLRQRTGACVVISERQGSLIRVGNQWSRLSATHFHLIEACDRISGAMATQDMDERLRAYASLTTYLPDTPGEGVSTSPLLRQFQVFDAGAFTLRLRIENGRLLFDPVLYARKTAQSGDDPLDEGNEPEPLLPEAANKDFVENLKENAGRYSLGGGRYVVLSPHLKRAMNTVKRLRDSQDIEAQCEFFSKPVAALRREFARDLGDEGLDEILDSLFLETSGYLSSRVIGIGTWQKPPLPGIQTEGIFWLPPEDDDETRVEDKEEPEIIELETANGRTPLAVKPSEKAVLHRALCRGRELGEIAVQFGEYRVLVTGENEQLTSLGQPAAAKGGNTDSGKPVWINKTHIDQIDPDEGRQQNKRPGEKSVPFGLKTTLMAHQIEGLNWIQDAWLEGMTGVLLADDMGLGKTIQVLAFLAWLAEHAPRKSSGNEGGFLIVAPTSLLKNWEKEHSTHLHAPGIGEVLHAHGGAIRSIRSSDGDGLDVDDLRRADWILTTYETLTGHQLSFARVRFRCLVLDEAQKIKSPQTQVTSAIKSLHADFTIAMTGTPVENRRADLWCISDAAFPKLLGTLKDFSAVYETEEAEEPAKQLNVYLMTGIDESSPRRFRELPQPFMKRRMKEEVLEGLPTKTSQTLAMEMPPAQAECYRKIVSDARGSTKSGAKLEAIQALRMASLHPWLVRDQLTGHVDRDFNHQIFISDSARIKSLVTILHRIRDADGGEKALIFVNSRRMQKWLMGLFAEEFDLPDVKLINGQTAHDERQKIVDQFEKSPARFDLLLLSPRAAGVGFTITAANHVIHLDRWWNPAVEDQCTDRVYRIGAKKPVTIWIPQAEHPDPDLKEHSFDLSLHKLLENKRKMSRELLAPVENKEMDTEQLFKAVVG
jgi:superfamily II DNA or RNA helicase